MEEREKERNSNRERENEGYCILNSHMYMRYWIVGMYIQYKEGEDLRARINKIL